MGLTIVVPTHLLVAIVTGFAMMVALIVLLATWRGRVGEKGSEMYIGGESEEILRVKIPSVASLYWALVKKSLRPLYEALVEKVHCGILNVWTAYMSTLLFVLMILASIAIVYVGYAWWWP